MKRVSAVASFLIIAVLLAFIPAMFFSVGYVQKLNEEIRRQFDGKRWALPAVIYARPLELHPGLKLSGDMLERELQLAGYRRESPVLSSGGYGHSGSTFQVVTRDFTFPSGLEKSVNVSISFKNEHIETVIETPSGSPVPFVRLDPARIGSFHPVDNEDRIVLTSSEIPDLLRSALLAVEDKSFYSHHGVSPIGISRSLLANIRAGRTVQGGSTLTQQLVKNFFLNRERTLSRKLQEAVMAILLEYHYSKDEIMTAYINEVFLGQDGARAVHGFALASQFYFRRALQDLSVAQIATLVGMVKGPSYYDPVRHQERCESRRTVVLTLMHEDGLIDRAAFDNALGQPLTEGELQKNGYNRFPAFLELVKRQLQAEYKEDEIQTSGLKILTTLDPQIQWQAEEQLSKSLVELEKRAGIKDLEGALVVSGRDNGEVHALIGGRKDLSGGFNRALDARRPVGSLIKPAVYLAALTEGYTLVSPVSDTEITIETTGTYWHPENYDKSEHGVVPLYTALAKSYNLATVRLGMDVGLEKVISTLNVLGYPLASKPYPSLLLGAIDMSPLQVAQMYQTISSGGFYLPLRTIRSVMAADERLLSRYGLEVEQRFDPEYMYLLTHALERVMQEGTGRSFSSHGSGSYAGKTGTSDGTRDSWFAGFSEDRLAVVWLGRDDNRSTSLTGASGALAVWGRFMEAIEAPSLQPSELSDINWLRIDTETLKPASSLNPRTTVLPFIRGSEPETQWPNIEMKTVEKEVRTLWESLSDLFK